VKALMVVSTSKIVTAKTDKEPTARQVLGIHQVALELSQSKSGKSNITIDSVHLARKSNYKYEITMSLGTNLKFRGLQQHTSCRDDFRMKHAWREQMTSQTGNMLRA